MSFRPYLAHKYIYIFSSLHAPGSLLSAMRRSAAALVLQHQQQNAAASSAQRVTATHHLITKQEILRLQNAEMALQATRQYSLASVMQQRQEFVDHICDCLTMGIFPNGESERSYKKLLLTALLLAVR